MYLVRLRYFFNKCLICVIVFSACEPAEIIPEEFQPYSSYLDIQESLPIDQRIKLIPEYLLSSTNTVDSLRTAQPERGFNVVPINENEHLVYLWSSNQLYQINKGRKALLIAEAGNDPHSIQAGIRMTKINNQYYLVQRARISEIACEQECKLQVQNTYDNAGSGFINSIYPFEPDTYIISSYNRTGGETIHLVDKNFDTIESMGEYFDHPNPSLVSYYNLADLTSSYSGNIFTHVYGSFPFIAVLNSSLVLNKVYKVHDFFNHHLTAGLAPFSLGYERDFLIPASTIVTVNPIREDLFWIIVVHQRHTERQIGFNPVKTAHFFDYYILDDQGLMYVGSLQDYAVPVDEHLYVLKDQMIYRLDLSSDDLLEDSYGEFVLPEGF